MNKEKIIVIDDEFEILEVLKEALKEAGFNVFSALSADDALDILKTTAIDLMVTDINMPGKDGLQLIEELRKIENYKNLPVIVLTGVKTKDAVVKGKELGVVAYLIKPFNFVDLISVVERILKRDTLEDDKDEDVQKKEKIEKEFKVLIVDDEEDIRDIFSEYLREFTQNIFTAEKVVHAIEFLESNTIDVLITDLSMPEKDGFFLVEWISNQPRHAGTSIIIITGIRKDKETLRRCVELGIDKFLIKPIFLDKLKKTITTVRSTHYRKEKYLKLLDKYTAVYEKYEEKNSQTQKTIIQQMEVLQEENSRFKKDYGTMTLITKPNNDQIENIKKFEDKIQETNEKLARLTNELAETKKGLSNKKRDIKQIKRTLGRKLDKIRLKRPD